MWSKLVQPRSTLLALTVILLIGGAIRWRLSQDQVLHNWDEKFHALVAKNMMDDALSPRLYKTAVLPYDYTLWYRNHIWLHKQPLPLWLMAASYKVFGVTEFATRIPSLLFSTLLILVLYLLAERLYSKKVALLAAFFLSVNGLVIELGAGRVATDHYDLLFLVFITLAIYLAQLQAQTKKLHYTFISGFFIGCALLTKWLPALIVLPVHYYFLKHYGSTKKDTVKALLFSIGSLLLIALPWQLYILHTFPQEARWEYFHHWLHVASELEGHTDPGYFYYLDKIRINYSELVYLPLLYFLWRLGKYKPRQSQDLALFIWIFVPLVFFSLAKTKMQGYVLFICPALFMLSAEFFFKLPTILQSHKSKSRSVLKMVLQIALIFLPLRYCYERSSFGLDAALVNAETEPYKSLPKAEGKVLVLNVKWPIEFMFYTGYIAYRQDHLSAEEQEIVSKSGYTVKYLRGSETLMHLE